jgi:PAS domain S-box-containing protein
MVNQLMACRDDCLRGTQYLPSILSLAHRLIALSANPQDAARRTDLLARVAEINRTQEKEVVLFDREMPTVLAAPVIADTSKAEVRTFLAKEDQAETRTPPLLKAPLISIGVMGALLCIAAFGARLLWRQLSNGILSGKNTGEKKRTLLVKRLALAMQHANDIILLLDEHGRILEANDRALDAYGYTLEELQRLEPGGLRPSGIRRSVADNLAQFESIEGTIFETTHQRKDGSVFQVEVSGTSFENDG